MSEKLALFGGPKSLPGPSADPWPVLGAEEIAAVTTLLEKGEISITTGTGIIKEFEQRFAEYTDARHAIVQCNGTSTLQSALYGVGVGYGDEVIVPTYTWPSCPNTVLTCNAVPVFCDVDPRTLTADPADIERRITPATKAIMVVHLWGHPANMDAVNDVARRHGIKVVEDCSHAHGATYKGRKVGTIGDVGCFSMQASKALPGGEAGVVITNDDDVFDRMLTLSHYGGRIELDSVTGAYTQFAYTGLGPKFRVHPLAAAIGNEQLKRLDATIAARRANLEYLSSGLTGLSGVTPPFTAGWATRGAWYGYRVHYHPEKLGGLPKERFLAALRAEGVDAASERYRLLHYEPLYQGPAIAGDCPYPPPAVRAGMRDYHHGDFPVAEAVQPMLISLPTFTAPSCRELVDQTIRAFRKVTANVEQLLETREPI